MTLFAFREAKNPVWTFCDSMKVKCWTFAGLTKPTYVIQPARPTETW